MTKLTINSVKLAKVASQMESMHRSGNRELIDARILVSGEFVEQMTKEAEGNFRYERPTKKHHQKIDEATVRMCKNEGVSVGKLKGVCRYMAASWVRARKMIGLVKE